MLSLGNMQLAPQVLPVTVTESPPQLWMLRDPKSSVSQSHVGPGVAHFTKTGRPGRRVRPKHGLSHWSRRRDDQAEARARPPVQKAAACEDQFRQLEIAQRGTLVGEGPSC